MYFAGLPTSLKNVGHVGQACGMGPRTLKEESSASVLGNIQAVLRLTDSPGDLVSDPNLVDRALPTGVRRSFHRPVGPMWPGSPGEVPSLPDFIVDACRSQASPVCR
jgi:hypothetical protein